jgi:sulfatase modifying factor 1
MKKIFVLPFVALGFLAFGVTAVFAQTPLVNVQTVTVGDAGNAPQNYFDRRGAVDYIFRIGKFEVTIEQYTAFLNSVASTTAVDYLIDLWTLGMGGAPTQSGISRSGNGTTSNPYIYAAIGNSKHPVDHISWFRAARFCNWLHNGATNGANTETGAYTLNGATDGVIDKNTNAKWWIPSFNEWWKAAYYKGGSTDAGYWTYPTQSDTRPGNLIGGGTNQANYRKDLVFSVTQTTDYSPLQNYRTAVGTFSNSPSAYGTFDQAGNILEWNDNTYQGLVTSFVGGTWGSAEGDLSGTTSGGTWDRTRYWPGWGFRVASAATTSSRLKLEKANSLTNQWQTVPITGAMITPEGELDVEATTNANEFYRLRILTVTQ